MTTPPTPKLLKDFGLYGTTMLLCTTEQHWDQAMRRMRVKDPDPMPDGQGAACSFILGDEFRVIVQVKPSDDHAAVLETLVHESVHAWQFYKERIGETLPGKEIEAYAIQSIWKTLVAEYARQHPVTAKAPVPSGPPTTTA